MTVNPGWVPPGVDVTKASIPRVYDYWLGGSHNFQADRDAARAAIALDPDMRPAARACRAFLHRAVRYLAAEAGIRQFLDIGSGIPTQRNVHHVAQEAAPGARVVYVDHDDVAVAHSRLMLNDNPDAAVIQVDLREPAMILAAPETQLLFDFDRPIAVILALVAHFIPDDSETAAIIATLRDALAPGSHLVIAHACRDDQPEMLSSFERTYNEQVNARFRPRTQDEIERLCDGFTLLDPGLVWVTQWRPDSPEDVPDDPAKYWAMVGVGRYDG